MTKEEQIQKEANEYVNQIEDNFDADLTFGDRVADKMSTFAGSWKFIFWMSGFLGVWITINTLQFTKVIHWDEPPFILLNLILSFVAAFQSPLILLSQNRTSIKDRYYANLDFKRGYISSREQAEQHEHLEEIIESTREIKEMYGETATMYNELNEILPLIKYIHKYITENGWNTK